MCLKGEVVETISFCYLFIKIGPHFQLMIEKHSANIYRRRACVLLYSLPGIISEARHLHGATQKLLTLGTPGAAQEHSFVEDALGTEKRWTASLVQNWWDVRNISAPLSPSDDSQICLQNKELYMLSVGKSINLATEKRMVKGPQTVCGSSKH